MGETTAAAAAAVVVVAAAAAAAATTTNNNNTVPSTAPKSLETKLRDASMQNGTIVLQCRL